MSQDTIPDHEPSQMLWDSVESFDKAIAANIPEVMQDVHNYSNVMPVRWYSKVLKQG